MELIAYDLTKTNKLKFLQSNFTIVTSEIIAFKIYTYYLDEKFILFYSLCEVLNKHYVNRSFLEIALISRNKLFLKHK